SKVPMIATAMTISTSVNALICRIGKVTLMAQNHKTGEPCRAEPSQSRITLQVWAMRLNVPPDGLPRQLHESGRPGFAGHPAHNSRSVRREKATGVGARPRSGD